MSTSSAHEDRFKEARGILAEMRSGHMEYLAILIDDLENELRRCGITLADLGASDEEISQIESQWHRQQAEYTLAELRRMKGEDFWKIRNVALQLLQDLDHGEFSLEDVGTSKEELLALGVDRNLF